MCIDCNNKYDKGANKKRNAYEKESSNTIMAPIQYIYTYLRLCFVVINIVVNIAIYVYYRENSSSFFLEILKYLLQISEKRYRKNISLLLVIACE